MTDLKKSFGIEKMSSMEVEAFLDQEYRAPGGVEKFAQVMAGVIYEDLLYEGRIRQVFDVYEASPGEDITFDADVTTPAVRMGVRGLPEEVEVRSDRTRIDTSPTAVKSLIRWNELNLRKFDIVQRTHDKMKAAIMKAEDTKGVAVIEAASCLFHSAIAATSANLLTKLAQARSTMMQATDGLYPVNILMNPYLEQYLYLLTTSAGTPLYVPSIQEEQLRKGVLGQIFGMNVISCRSVGTTVLYVLGPKEFVGKLAVRTEIDTKTHAYIPDFGDLILAWIDEGWLVRYSRAIIKLTIS